jgi:hypothetical protein
MVAFPRATTSGLYFRTLTLNLAKDEKMEGIHVKVRGVVRVETDYREMGEDDEGQAESNKEEAKDFIDIPNLEQYLWRKDQGSLAGGPNLPMVGDKVRAGKYDFNWGPIVLPEVCQDSHGANQRLPLPPSFYKRADSSLQYVQYYVKVSLNGDPSQKCFHSAPLVSSH